ALARSLEARVRQALGMPAELPVNGYPGEYLADLASEYLEEQRARGADACEALEALVTEADERERLESFGRYAVSRIVEQQRRVLRDFGVEFDVWASEQRDVRDLHLPEKVLEELAARRLTYEAEGALWFRSSALGEETGDDKDRVLRRSNGEVTYFAVDVAYHHYVKYAHARIKSIDKQVAEQGIVVPPLGEVDLSPLRAGEELAIIKRLVQYPEVVKGAAHALEPHRLAYWLQELAGGFHPYYKT